MAQDILLDEDNDMMINGGDLAVGDSDLQEVALLLGLSQGELKKDPVLGPGLTRKANAPMNMNKLQQLVRKHLERDGKDYDEVKKLIELTGLKL